MSLPVASALDAIHDTGREPELIFLLAFLGTFAFIRTSAHMINAGVSWWPGNVNVGGTHIHHLVWGILTIMLTGFLAFSFQPDSPWLELLAVGFGIGCGLTLDEFALWLHLEDVYWADEGRQSVDAIIFAAIIGGAALMGTVPLGADSSSSWPLFVLTVGGNLAFCTVAALKGKYTAAVAGMLLPPVAWVAAVRLARPGSWWARRRYSASSEKLEKATAREQRHESRRRWIQDHIGGMSGTG
jgi:hypothetical protein